MSGAIPMLYPNDRNFDALEKVCPPGVELTRVDSKQPLDQQVAQLKEAKVIIGVIPIEVARACPNLKLVQVPSAGTDRLDVKGLSELGIKVANGGGGNAIGVCEHAVALILSVYRRLHLQFESVRSRKWAGDVRAGGSFQGHELTGKTVGIIGLGNIGQQLARHLQGWSCSLIYVDVVDHPAELKKELNVTRVSIDELLKTSDVVTLHVPLTADTQGLISDRELDMMKPTAVLINTCRGRVVDERALVKALAERRILGAGLDVLEVEPTHDENPLLDMDNAVVTPHMAGWAEESWQRSRAFAVQNAARVANGEEPESVVSPQ